MVDKQLAQETTEDAVKHLSVHVVAKYPHDSGSFTEGLEYYNGFLYESAGNLPITGGEREVKRSREVEKDKRRAHKGSH